MAHNPIRVLLVDDSKIALAVLSKGLAKASDITVVGTASNGFEALTQIPKYRPDIICTDYFMPQMDGLELTKKVMQNSPIPILVMSSRLDPKSSSEVFYLLEAGALDCIKKPISDESDPSMQMFIEKIRILSKIYLHRRLNLKQGSTSNYVINAIKPGKYRFVIIGASTGGPNILMDILSTLPENFPAPIICIQHISPGFLQPFVDWLRLRCKMKVEILMQDKHLERGVIYLPKEGYHIEMKSTFMAGLTLKPPFHGHRPSITVAMKSVAEAVRNDAIGILLTGMGDDGAEGMVAMTQAKALTIAQSEESCTVFGMPKEAISLGGATLVLNPIEIKALLLRLFMLTPAD